jgi:hypothetical protein
MKYINNMRKVILIALHFCLYASYSQKIDLAITNCNVITLKENAILKNKTILISGSSIIAVVNSSSWKNSSNTTVLDATGKYVIPALTDMHVHLNPFMDKYSLPLFLKYGITTVRVMAGNDQVLQKRDSINKKLLRNSPDIYSASELIDGNPPSFGKDHSGPIVTSESDIEKIIYEQIKKGYDFIKLYSRLDENSFRKGLSYAKKQGFKVAYHIPVTLQKQHFFDINGGEIEHLSGYSRYASKLDSLPKKILLKNYDVPFDEISAKDIDFNKLNDAVRKTVAYNIWNCPTLVLFYNQTDEVFCKSILKNKIGDGLDGLLGWWSSVGYGKKENVITYIDFQKKTVALLHKNNAKILAGTDFPNPWLVPGLSLHQELERMVDAGLSNYEALKTATVNPAEWFGKNYNKGTVEKNKQADLLILNDNPLVDIKNTQKIHKVVYKGEVQ